MPFNELQDGFCCLWCSINGLFKKSVSRMKSMSTKGKSQLISAMRCAWLHSTSTGLVHYRQTSLWAGLKRKQDVSVQQRSHVCGSVAWELECQTFVYATASELAWWSAPCHETRRGRVLLYPSDIRRAKCWNLLLVSRNQKEATWRMCWGVERKGD